jgi:hypothetical protein
MFLALFFSDLTFVKIYPYYTGTSCVETKRHERFLACFSRYVTVVHNGFNVVVRAGRDVDSPGIRAYVGGQLLSQIEQMLSQ